MSDDRTAFDRNQMSMFNLLLFGGNLGNTRIDQQKYRNDKHAGSDKKTNDTKRDAEKDRQYKRLPLPPSVKLLANLDLPIDMVDPSVYLEVTMKCLQDCQALAKSNKYSNLTDSLEQAIKKCQKIIDKGPDELARKRKDKEIAESDIVKILKKANFMDELEELDLSKVKSRGLREKIGGMLAKRPPQVGISKDQWETDYFNHYREKYPKKE